MTYLALVVGRQPHEHFTNRVFERDPVLIKTIATAFQSVEYLGKPSGEVQFLGIFDTVAAIGGLMDGFDPHDGNNFPVSEVTARCGQTCIPAHSNERMSL